VPLRAAGGIDKSILLNDQAITQLEQRAEQANPREQCFLYTELVSAMTETAGKQLNDGEIDRASATLKKVARYAQLIHMNLARDTKRLKNAEMMMHRTTYRLTEFLHHASTEDKPTLQATLKQLSDVQNEILTQVFNH
jgi:citrate lyase beta subunit